MLNNQNSKQSLIFSTQPTQPAEKPTEPTQQEVCAMQRSITAFSKEASPERRIELLLQTIKTNRKKYPEDGNRNLYLSRIHVEEKLFEFVQKNVEELRLGG